MELVSALFEALSAGLGLWKSKESRKYLDKLIKLERAYYEATNQSDENWDDAIIDNIAFELQLLSKAFNSSVGKQNAENK